MEKIEKLKKEREEIDKRIETLEYAELIFEEEDKIYYIDQFGNVTCAKWDNSSWIEGAFSQGHIFRTEQEAETEAKRRNLLTRFRAVRNECNGDWKADWADISKPKFSVSIYKSKLKVYTSYLVNSFEPFGYFKNEKDAERAIELFGDEIKELFVECE